MDVIRLLVTLVIAMAATELVQGQSSSDYGPSSQTAVPTRTTRQPDFGIPFQLAASASGTTEVRLYVSSDRGGDWKMYQRQPPSSQGFQFQAPNDGEYWFAVRTIDDRGTSISEQSLRPELKVIVDTQQPRLDLRVDVKSNGQATADWIARDPGLAASTFLLEYQVQDGSWQDVHVRTPSERDPQQNWEGNAEWWLRTRGTESAVRAEIRDRAGNSTLVHKRVSLARVASQPFPNESNTHGGLQTAPMSPVGDNMNDLADGIRSRLPSWLKGVRHTQDDFSAAQGPRVSDRKYTGDSASNRSDRGNDRAADVHSPNPAQPYRSVVGEPVANRYPQGFGDPSQPQLRPRITSSPNFELDYELFDVGPEGVRLVELWISRDNGTTWELHGSDPDKRSPLEVQLKKEGLYGFRLAVHGFDVPAPPPPQDGAQADIWVGVDWTKPTGRITRAAFVPGLQSDRLPSDTLLIEWTAVDALMAAEPITLTYSESREGPWLPLATNLRNSGSYRWHVDQQLPARFYVQMEIRDLAGSITTTVYATAVSAKGQNPTGRIHNLRPQRRTTQRPPFIR